MAYPHTLAHPGTLADPQVRTIGIGDLKAALRRGLDDFAAMPSHAIFLCLIYPLVGFFLGGLTLGFDVLPLFYPLAAGFALVGPFAAIGLYELSRRREQGQATFWTDAFDVFRSHSIGSIAALGLLLTAIFIMWLVTAQSLYQSLFGLRATPSIAQFAQDILTTPAGWTLVLVGNGIGFLFALLVLTISVVSFPLLLDRDVGPVTAVLTSIRAVYANPGPMALWGLIVAGLLLIGSLPLFFGLAVVMPVLGHATWHLYRKVVQW